MSFVTLPGRALIAFRSLFEEPVKMRNATPIISFSFDDFPRSAYRTAGPILTAHGFRGTYYAALSLMGTHEPVGEIFSQEDLAGLVAEGHELGCHTFAHCDTWSTPPAAFEQSIIDNARRLKELLPGASFKSLSFPLSAPRLNTKRRAARYFGCCRVGGQTYNAAVVDPGRVSAYFLEQAEDLGSVKKMIDRSLAASGWLIFATHDVCDEPSRWGCSPAFFEDVVRYVARSGATVLPVGEAWNVVRGLSEHH